MEHARSLDRLAAAGVSLWLDDLRRDRIDGRLRELVEVGQVKGVTTNPTIFARALSESSAYDAQLEELRAAGADVEEAVRATTVADVRAAADVLRPVYEATDGADGYVSLEVDPRLARDTEGTVAEAAELWAAVDRPNLMIKVPATVEGLPAVRRTLAAGINVNVTLIFSRARYAQVVDAFLGGLEDALAAGRDVGRLASVASFFVSRIDSAVDPRLDALGTPEAAALRGRVALANARLAYHQHLDVLAGDRWKALAAAGARPQRPLWASTGVKDERYAPTAYVTGLVADGVVNTVPEPTLVAVVAYDGPVEDTITGAREEAESVLGRLGGLGIDLDAVTDELERRGVELFVESWEQLLATVEKRLSA